MMNRTMVRPMLPIPRRLLLIACLATLPWMSGGCNVIGVAANALPPPKVGAKYKGLAGQKVGVMVWADRATAINWPDLALALGGAVQAKMEAAQHEKLEEVKDVISPSPPASYLRFEREHPEIAAEDVTTFAPRLGVTRLIYVEITDFTTRAAASQELFRG